MCLVASWQYQARWLLQRLAACCCPGIRSYGLQIALSQCRFENGVSTIIMP